MRKVTNLIMAGIVSAAICSGLSAAKAGTLASSTFDTNVDGWAALDISGTSPTGAVPPVDATYSVDYHATGGNPGGYISETDQSTGTYYYNAPSKFLGDQSSAENGTLSFDIMDTEGSNSLGLNTAESPVILVGTTESLYLPDETSMSTTAFETLSFTLAPGNHFTVNSQGGTAATAADFASVLGNLQAVYILGDYYDNTETSSLDNVALTMATVTVPTPAALPAGAILFATLAAGGMARKIRRA
ncbi:MAG TPA: laminin B domain-containing protein [Tepidisphaeraceae bacterium]